MKFLPAALTLSCAALLIGCGRPVASESDADKQEQERLAEEQQEAALSALHEKEAALDERAAVIAQREQQLSIPTPSEQPRQAAPAPTTPAPTPGQEASPAPEASYQAFYDALSAYGEWLQLPNYGYVWQPAATVQDYAWRPYTLGHWVYTDDGWAWVSNEPFGWITYHYGRWMRTRALGWVWVPDDQWAPAWVSWRYGNDFIGWAPLPPEARFDPGTGIQQWADDQYNLAADDYTFVPASEFGDDSMASVEVPPDQTGPIYDDSTNETNIYYDSGAYAIICYGPNYDFMRSKARGGLPPQLRLSRDGFRADGKNGNKLAGNTLHITAPRLIPPRTPAAPKHLRGYIADTRLVAPRTPPPPVGTIAEPLYHPPQEASVQPGSGAPAASQGNPTRFLEPRQSAAATNEPPPPPENAARDVRNGSTLNPPTQGASEAGIQNAREAEAIQQQQAERERQAEAELAVQQAQRAEELRAGQARAAAEEQAAREQQATGRAETIHTPQTTNVPAGTQQVGNQPPGSTQTGVPGRTQQ